MKGGTPVEEKREDNLDLRQRKTRRQLTQALVELMEERPFQELSVGPGPPHHLLRPFQRQAGAAPLSADPAGADVH